MKGRRIVLCLLACCVTALDGSAARALGAPGTVFRDCPNCPEMVVIPAGTFLMGSPADAKDAAGNEFPQHRVTLAKPFALGKYELTFVEWRSCMAAAACPIPGPRDEGWGQGRRPVINVSWHDAKAYIAWLSRKTGKAYRLPSEAEWEYAARAGAATPYAWGGDVGRNKANCSECASESGGKMTAPAGSFAPNRFGLHDMHGNVWEFVEDCWNGNYRGAPDDGRPWLSGECTHRVLRGGSVFFGARYSRATARLRYVPKVPFRDIGFRLARSLD